MSIDRIDPGLSFAGISQASRAPLPGDVKKSDETAPPVSDSVDIGSSKEAEKPEQKPEEAPAKKKWTVLAYLTGKDGTLQRLAPAKMRQLEVAGSDENMDVVAQLSRQKSILDKVSKDWSGTKRYHVEKNDTPPSLMDEMKNWFIPPYTQNIKSPVLQDMGAAVDAADPATVKEFLNWGIKNYPAEHYAIIFYSQGGGFAGSIRDGDSGNVIDNKEMGDIMREAARTAGQKIDLVAFDGSMMADAEVAAELKDSAKVLVGAQGVTGQGSIPLDGVMKDLKFELGDRDITAEELAKFFVFEAKYQPAQAAEMLAPTFSAIDLEKFGAVKDSFNSLAKELQHCVKAKPDLKEALREDIKKTQNFIQSGEPYQDYRDITHFAETVMADERFNNYNFPAIKKVAQDLINASQAAVIDNAHIGQGVKNAKGISAYMPTDFGFDMAPTFFDPPNFDPKHGYDKEIFALETEWNELLGDIAKDTKTHDFMKKMGIPPHMINKMEKAGGLGVKAGKYALSIATNAGHYEAYQAMRNKPPSGFFYMPAGIATKVGIVGGGRQAFNGAAQIFEGITNDTIKNRQTMIVDGGLDTATGAAVMATCAGYTFAQLAGITRPAGIAAFAIPFAKMAYDFYMQRKGVAKQREEVDAMKPSEKLARLDQDRALEQAGRAPEKGPTYISPIVRGVYGIGNGPIDPEDLAKQ